jgi:tripartite-type tricarboxylate transporter receptor subunit TctC
MTKSFGATRRHVVGAIGAAGLAALLPARAGAQGTWPQRAVRLILPFGAGSATDVAARLMIEPLQARWAQPLVIENKPGGDGMIAINAFLQANDEHVLLYSSSASFLSHPYTQEKLSYRMERDFAPIARVTDTVLSFNVPASSRFKTFPEFVAAAKAEPGKLNVTGAAGVPDFTLDYFLRTQGLQVTKIPFRNVVEAATALAGNQIDALLTSVAIVRPLVQSEKIRMLAVAARKRAAFLPDVPSVVELGAPALVVETTAGLYGPREMPLALRERIGADVSAVVTAPAVVERLAITGQVVNAGGPREMAESLKQQSDQLAVIAKELGLKRAD